VYILSVGKTYMQQFFCCSGWLERKCIVVSVVVDILYIFRVSLLPSLVSVKSRKSMLLLILFVILNSKFL
jgi:hypothetical protein